MSVVVDYLIYAIEQEKEKAAWDLWCNMYPFMTSGIIQEFIKFEEFKSKLFQKQYKYTQKSLEDVEKEMLVIVMKHEGR